MLNRIIQITVNSNIILATNNNSNGLSSPISNLKRIDDEISQIKEMPKIQKNENKKKIRTCEYCILF